MYKKYVSKMILRSFPVIRKEVSRRQSCGGSITSFCGRKMMCAKLIIPEYPRIDSVKAEAASVLFFSISISKRSYQGCSFAYLEIGGAARNMSIADIFT